MAERKTTAESGLAWESTSRRRAPGRATPWLFRQPGSTNEPPAPNAGDSAWGALPADGAAVRFWTANSGPSGYAGSFVAQARMVPSEAVTWAFRSSTTGLEYRYEVSRWSPL